MLSRTSRITSSLRVKITLLACAASFATALVMSGLAYLRTTEISFNTAIESLAGESRLAALQFRETFRNLGNDATIIAQMPPISGFIRSREHGGVDPDDGSLTAQWEQRLATIFTSVMRTHPSYSQIRYIGIADNGRELVRVNRVAGGFETVAAEELQQKAGESYFQQGAALPPGAVFFSPVTYNREHGQIDSAMIPTVRGIVPVFGPDGELFGMIVINANYETMLAETFRTIELSTDTFIVTQAGDYMEYTAEGTISHLELASNYTRPPPAFLSRLQFSGGEAALVEADSVKYFTELPIDDRFDHASLGIVVSVPRDELMAPVLQTQRQSLVLGAVLILLSSIVTALIANQLTKPLRQMTQEISRARSHLRPIHLPVRDNDEIGELARAFQLMTEGLQENEFKTRSIINSVVDGLIVVDEFGNIDSYNPACERIFGYEPDEMTGRSVAMLLPPQADPASDLPADLSAPGAIRSLIGAGREVTGQRKDGSTFPMDLSVSEILLNNRPLYCGIVRDITERKQVNIMKDEFISTVNHELRTPLTSIHGALGLLKIKTEGRLDDKSAQLLELAHNSCQRLTTLVNDILDLEKIAAGKIEYHKEAVEICGLVGTIVAQNDSMAEARGVTLRRCCGIGATLVRLDQNRFNQALVNLLSNAIRYSPQGGEVTVSAMMSQSDRVRISVADHGPGIPEAFRSKVFDCFAQADSSLTRQEGSSGLGLNITQTLIEAFGGAVSFETEEGQGTVFHLDLPVCSRQEEAA
ncbi:ATP-binding protein [Maricaulis sp.]|uniref:ATP-binding protein n=1 Tax=Maricaulis sp. TaxID=1486257 RepID=UPI003A8FCC18